MQRLSKREKLVLIQVIKSCEKYSLNESESMGSIRKLCEDLYQEEHIIIINIKCIPKYLETVPIEDLPKIREF